jgi:hypothetical protein
LQKRENHEESISSLFKNFTFKDQLVANGPKGPHHSRSSHPYTVKCSQGTLKEKMINRLQLITERTSPRSITMPNQDLLPSRQTIMNHLPQIFYFILEGTLIFQTFLSMGSEIPKKPAIYTLT